MTKTRWTRRKNIDYQDTSSDDEVVNSISQSVIIQNICEQTLLDTSIISALPSDLENIYKSMLSDLSFINSTQIAKDYSFYNCKMTFLKGEETVRLKRKAIIEYLRNQRKKIKLIPNESNDKICQQAIVEEADLKSEETRPHRKRKAPSKFSQNYLVAIDHKSEDDNPEKCIDLISSPKKVSQNKPVVVNNERLKEQLLLDKILLGVTCVRQWTEKGLFLSKVSESDLCSLNRRLSNAKFMMSDLTEHTDDNNNKSLSMFVQSIRTGTNDAPLVPEDDAIVHCRLKSAKQHISAMYRPRHNVPSILARPSLTTDYSRSQALPTFSAAVTTEDTSTIERVSDPSMSASRLMKLKAVPTKPAPSNDTPPSSIATNVVSPAPTIIYRTLDRHSNLAFPLFLSPLTSIVQHSFHAPLFHAARVPGPGGTQGLLKRITGPMPRLLPSITESSHSTVLKNLLQQSPSNPQQRSSSTTTTITKLSNGTSSHMVPLSVFRSSSNNRKWPNGSFL